MMEEPIQVAPVEMQAPMSAPVVEEPLFNVTAPMQPTTEIIAPGIDKTLGIDFVALHKSMPISLIKDLIIGDTNLKHKAISDRQLFQIHKIKQGL